MPEATPTFPTQEEHRWLNLALKAGLTAGTLDALGAIVWYDFVLAKTTIPRIFQGIASGVFGKSAFDNSAYAWSGLFFHYLIAFSFATAYVFLYPRLRLLRRNPWLSGVVYGMVVWTVMNEIVLPLVGLGRPATISGALTGVVILICCVGIPIAFVVRKQHAR